MKPLRRKSDRLKRDNNVYMPYKKAPTRPIRKNQINIFKKIRDKQYRKRKPLKVPKFTIYIILVIIFLGISYLAIEYINNLRNQNGETSEQTYVIGLENIPTYPNSVFIFENSTDENSVRNFLSQGNSAYRLPNNTDMDNVFEYYSEQLPTLGWTLIQTVSMESEDKKYGQYWVLNGIGLRIYSKYNDIWYETVTQAEAESGLAERVQAEIARDLLLVDEDYQDLLPDFPWVLEVPKEYLISYKVSVYDDTLQQVTISKIGADESIKIVPVAINDSRALDYALEDYVGEMNDNAEEQWKIINTYVIYTDVGSGLRGTIETNSNEDEVAVIQNSYNDIVYVLDSNTVGSEFLDYVLENIQPQNATKY